jgi:hypothetical protein
MMAAEPGEVTSETAILEALVTAAVGKGLYVQCLPDLAGAFVASATVDAYVIAARDGFSVELWHAEDTDAFRIEHFDNLPHAAEAAVAAATECAGHETATGQPHLLEAL